MRGLAPEALVLDVDQCSLRQFLQAEVHGLWFRLLYLFRKMLERAKSSVGGGAPLHTCM
jgi:hypothetical protein